MSARGNQPVPIVPSALLGDGLEVSAQGLGGMVLSEAYGPADDTASVDLVHRAIDAGITLLDTADIYGRGHNERLFDQVLKDRRDEVVVATKFGIVPDAPAGQPRAQGDPDHVRASVEASLVRLGIDTIDLYYYHRVDPRVDIEETIGAMAELVSAGKVRHLGLSEVTAAELRRAHRIHPIAAVQSEWSVLSRDVEREVIPQARELGVGFVAYSPLGRGLLTGGLDSAADLPPEDNRRNFPRFDAGALEANAALVQTIRDAAGSAGRTPAQIVLAWLYRSAEKLGITVVPIPGTRRTERVIENLGSIDLGLPAETLAALDGLAARVTGERNREPLSVSLGRERRDRDQRDSEAITGATDPVHHRTGNRP